MSVETKNMLKSWGGTFVSALIAALLAILTTTGKIPIDAETWTAIVFAGLVSVLPVVKNYFDKNYLNYGKVSESSSDPVLVDDTQE